MPSATIERVRIPLGERWREARLQVFPVLVFAAAVGGILFLWENNDVAPSMVGQAEPVLANVSSHKAGVVSGLYVKRFARVKANQIIGEVVIADPTVVTSSLAVVQADISMMAASLAQVMRVQHNQLSTARRRLDWMLRRAELAMAKARLEQAEAQARRVRALYEDDIVSERKYLAAQADCAELRAKVSEFSVQVEEEEKAFAQIGMTQGPGIDRLSDEAVKAAFSMREAKLRLTEAALAPIQLKAPLDGIVTGLFCIPGQAVTAGQPIVAIATLEPVRVVGYMRAPSQGEVKAGMRVEVRRRGSRGDCGIGQIIEVGTQWEAVPDAVLGPLKFLGPELGLPVSVTLPTNFNLRAGEVVDLVVLWKKH